MDRKQDRTEQDRRQRDGRDTARDHERRDEGRWADEAAQARTAGDPRARTPRDATGQPSTRSFDE